MKDKETTKYSFDIDPAFKGLYEILEPDKVNIPSFENIYPSDLELTHYAKETSKLPELKSKFRDSLNTIANTFSKAFTGLKGYKEIDLQLQKILIENYFQTARALAITVEARDPYTGGHSDRVFQIAKELGKRCNLSTIEQLYLEGGALLHDVGKIGIRDSVLLKAGPLTDEEYKEMQFHPIIGAQIIKKFSCLQGCLDAVLYHHERIDGYGYPYGLKGHEIPMTARITSIVDAYDAMTTNRIYRKAIGHEQALEEILRNSGTQFDSEIVNVFVKWWEENYQNKLLKDKTVTQ